MKKENNNVIHYEDFVAEINDSEISITGYNGTDDDVIIPDEIDGLPVVHIGDNAFYKKGLTSVFLPSELKTIGDYAFENNNLEDIWFDEGLISIGKNAFYANNNCYLRNELPSTLVSIGERAFFYNRIGKL